MNHVPTFLPLLAAVIFGFHVCAAGAADATRVYFGTYTGSKSKGIYVSAFDPGTGRLGPVELAAQVTSPSFLEIHPNKKVVYAVNETSEFDGKPTGAVSAFAIDEETGLLRLLNQQPSGGQGPCHVAVDRTGQTVLVANYGGGSAASFPVGPDGRLGAAGSVIQHHGSSVNPQRQKGPHAHCINLDPSNRFALVADLGMDKVMIYRLNTQHSTLAPNEPAAADSTPGAGPRHVAFHPSGQFLYVINELDCTVAGFQFDSSQGRLKPVQTISSLPGELKPGYSTAEIEVHPTGKFLYGSNRGHDSIAVFAIDQKTGQLRSVQHQTTGGKTPRNFGVDPSGRYLLAANQSSDTVVVFGIDAQTGTLTETGQQLEVPTPVCVKFW